MKLNPANAHWLAAPAESRINQDKVELTTDPGTDFWQGTYYGFRIANSPALLWEGSDNFTFTVRAKFRYCKQFDQCGVMVYLDEQNWCKASIEHEEESEVRLGSVVTNHGYSDWATTDIAPVEEVYYRLSRRGPDFLIEYSFDGQRYCQMRIFHMALLGDTSIEMSKADPPIGSHGTVKFGVYACSPGDSSFTATFDCFTRTDSIWKPHR